MTAVKIICAGLGAAFLHFGYAIYFRKRYGLINGFEAELKRGKRTEEYAKKVGLIEFITGCVLAAVTVLLLIFA